MLFATTCTCSTSSASGNDEISLVMFMTSEYVIATTSDLLISSKSSMLLSVQSSMQPTSPPPTAPTTITPSPTTTTNPCQGSRACGNTATCVSKSAGLSFYCRCKEGHYLRNESLPMVENQSGDNCRPGQFLGGNLTLDTTYTPELANKSSTQYKNLVATAKQKLEGVLRQEYGNVFERVVIDRIRNGSIIFDFRIIMRSNSTNNATQIALTISDLVTTVGNANVSKTYVAALDVCVGSNRPCLSTNQVCTPTNGGFQCGNCRTGYRYNSSTNICNDINECIAQPSFCHNQNRTCTNAVGSFSCQSCPSDKQYDRVNRSCVVAVSCTPNPCRYSGTCIQIRNANSITCKCIIFFKGDRCQNLTDIGIAIIAIGSTVVILIILAITAVCYYVRTKRKGVRHPTRQCAGVNESEQIVMDKLLKPQIRAAQLETNVPTRPYAGEIGGKHTSVTYEDRQMLTRSKVFEE
ncbi:uncharacterized protein TRIADDRAFT_63592 [Trichoplax adhaerens]|uniref:EGF-like domain-containing protein n=1 Tax=Trichoplax adhaerens TaxID=10228 RepID=B3RKD1_TRIAD|nr:hypothetical protein TRIADDRAFT_63592 [Trichoplax adhaerens]EDV29178.1 hypothetical protein TRIADDRAFT_63592 [Trichoplax adhaerens]|eukprot:XP_002108380.1 hypothetical protein TRIADDRAFT_63592 [Trichoplax adhaerens]